MIPRSLSLIRLCTHRGRCARRAGCAGSYHARSTGMAAKCGHWGRGRARARVRALWGFSGWRGNETEVLSFPRRKAFIRKWRLKCRAVADSLEEAGDRLFTFTRLPPNQWRSARTTNAIERLHEEFKRRIKTQTVLPSAETAAMLFWALLASGQINMRN